ncbi:MAG: AsmA-like C-terminal region-containing protein [Deltaproteobacteria bacterium]|nr:AsmA-like C-terminal region-containing protein [Deltaproteobacteria bacterium]
MSQRVRRIARRLALGGLIVLLLAAVAGFWLLRAQKSREWLGEQLAARLGPTVRFGDAGLTLWPPLSVTLDDVAWLGEDGTPAATAQRIRARISFRALLRRQLAVSLVQIDHPAATLVRDDDGTLRLGGRALGGAAGGDDAVAADLDAQLPRLRLSGGAVLFIDRSVAPPRRIALTDLRATVEPLRPGARIAIDASGPGSSALRVGAVRLDRLSGEATLAACRAPLRGEARFEATEVEATTLAAWLPAALADLTTEGRLRIGGDLRGTLAGGEVRAFAELADGRLAWKDWQAGSPAALRGAAAWRDAAPTSANAELDLGAVHHPLLDATALHAALKWDGHTTTLSQARASAYGGTWTQSGTLTLADPPTLDGGVRGEGIDGAAAVRALIAANADLRGLQAAGPLTISAEGRGTLGQSTRGRVELRQASGHLGWSATEVRAPLALAADLVQQNNTWSLANGTVTAAATAIESAAIRDLDGRFAFANGVLRVDALSAQVNGEAWKVSGTLPLRPGVTGTLRASGRAGGVDLPELEASFVRTRDTLQLPSLRARVFGATWTGSAKSISAAGIDARLSTSGANLDTLLEAVDDTPGAPRSAGGVATLTADLALRPADQHSSVGLDLRLSSGKFLFNQLAVDAPAHFTGTLRESSTGLAIDDAHASAAAARYGPLRATQASGDFTFDADTLAFSNLTFTSAGGAWQHRGRYLLDGAYPFEGSVAVTNLDPAALTIMFGIAAAPLDGAAMTVNASLRGNVINDWAPTLNGSGTMTVRGGTLRSTAVLAALWDALLRRARRSEGTPHNPLRTATASVTVHGGAVHSSDLQASTQDYSMTGSGSVGFDGRLDLDTRVTLTAAGLQHMISLGVVPLPTALLPTFPPIPARISGTVEQPIVRPDVSALPASTMRWAANAAINVPRAIGAAVAKPFESLFDDVIGSSAPTPTPE